MKEVWKDVDGYDGDYQVSNIGNVKSLKQNKERIMKKPLRSGYESVQLINKLGMKNMRVHQLVANSFVGCKQVGTVVNHKDGNKLNNYVENLEWVTSSENNKHAMENKLNHAPRGSKQNFSRLNDSKVIEIVKRLEQGESPNNICVDYNVSSRSIYDIKLGNTWSWLTGR
jgi:uncharacterized protein YjcR